MEDLKNKWIPVIGSISWIIAMISMIAFIWTNNAIVFKTFATALVIFLVCAWLDR